SLPIIFITGLCDIPTSAGNIKGGATDFLTKPVNAYELGISEKTVKFHRGETMKKLGVDSALWIFPDILSAKSILCKE
ncbi:MAG: hypothetical protein EHM79_01240, partial [Geobacter sp.]